VAAEDLVGRVVARLKRFAYDSFGRDRWQQPDRILPALTLKDGDRVADLGAGGGYFTFRLAHAVAPSGLVYALDVDEPMLADLARRAQRDGIANIRTIEPPADDPSLPEPVDVIFLSHAYHHIEDRPAYFARAARYLTPAGRVAILEGNCEGLFSRLFGHATRPDTIRSEMEQAGYRLLARHDFVRRDSFSIFVPTRGPSTTTPGA
jgi:arsenite methyltransferase